MATAEMAAAKQAVLLVGESWMTSVTHSKGWDQMGSVTYDLGAECFFEALADSPFTITHLPSHLAARDFPQRLPDLQRYQAVILSDIGANTLLLHPDTWTQSKPTPNRLKLLREYVAAGGGLAMMGGYYSYQGLNGGARYHRTAVEEALPVTLLPFDDRVEVPEGFRPEVVQVNHPIVAGITGPWPILLGYNEVQLKTGADVTLIARVPDEAGGSPLLVAGEHGDGRTLAWTTDIAPHWLPPEFASWPGYARLWTQALTWLTKSA